MTTSHGFDLEMAYALARGWLARRVARGRPEAQSAPPLELPRVLALDAASSLVLLFAAARRLDAATSMLLDAAEAVDSAGRTRQGVLERLFAGAEPDVPALHAALEPTGALRREGWLRVEGEVAGGAVLRVSAGGVRALLAEPPPAHPPADGSLLARMVLPLHVRALVECLVAAEGRGALDDGAVVAITGPAGVGKTGLARALVAAWGRSSRWVDAGTWGALAADEAAVRALLDDAQADGAVLVFDGCDAALSRHAARVGGAAALRQGLGGLRARVLLLAQSPGDLDDELDRHVQVRLPLAAPGPTERAQLWGNEAPEVPDAARLALARRYELSGAQIANAARAARWLRGDGRLEPDWDGAAAMQLERDGTPTRAGRMTLGDLMLPEDVASQVAAIVAAARNRPRVLDAWGFGRRFSSGLGISALFHGEPGTGKTLAAEVIASELHMPLSRVNVAQVLDKYVGETEKNLERAFRAARASGSVLLFDEADALFSQRMSVEHSQDRAANLEINLLLQLVERFDGIVILTTNLKQGIDKAFERRLGYKIDFPFPDEGLRARIWRHLLPPEAPVASNVDFAELAHRYELSGGSVKNAVLRAAYAAAAASGPIDMACLEVAAEEECAAAGKLVGPRGGRDPRDPFGF